MRAAPRALAPLGVIGFLWTASSGLHNLMDVFETAARVASGGPGGSSGRWRSGGWSRASWRRACWRGRSSAWTRAMQTGSPTGAAARRRRAGGSRTAASAPPAVLAAAPASARSRAPSTPSSARAERSSTASTRRCTRRSSKRLASALMLAAGAWRCSPPSTASPSMHPAGVGGGSGRGVTAVVSWLVVSWGFGLYAVSMSSYALYYGSLAAVAVMLIWLYLTSLRWWWGPR